MKKIFVFLVVLTFVICPNAQADKKLKEILLKPVGIVEIDDKDLTIKEITPGLPGEKAGLKVGDEIKKINNKRFYSYKKLLEYLDVFEAGKDIIFEVKRGKEKETIAVMPRDERPRIGFSCAPKRCCVIDKKLKTSWAHFRSKDVEVMIGHPIITTKGIFVVSLEIRNYSDKDITFDPNQVRVLAAGMPLTALSPEQVTDMEFIELSVAAKLPPLQPTQASSVSTNVNVGGPAGSYTISGPGGQIRVQEDFGSAFARSMREASQARIEEFKAAIAAYPILKRQALENGMIAREKTYLDLLRQTIKKTNIKSNEVTRGVMTFDNSTRIPNIEIAVIVEDETFKVRFNEFMRYTPK